MKKRIQKYLSGSNEGFSLVELIIVIAIMAILVGVVALADVTYLKDNIQRVKGFDYIGFLSKWCNDSNCK